MFKYEYLVLYMSKNGLGRVSMVLDAPVTGMEGIEAMDKMIRNQKEQDGEADNEAFVLSYSFLKSFQM